MYYDFDALLTEYNKAIHAEPGTRLVYEDVDAPALQQWLDNNYPGGGPGYEFVFPNNVKVEVHMRVKDPEVTIQDAEIVEDAPVENSSQEENTTETAPTTEEPIPQVENEPTPQAE